MGVFRVPPGRAVAPALPRALRERAATCSSGSMRIRWGERLEQQVVLEPRDLLYVPPHETHVLENLSETEPAEYVVARDSPTEDSVEVPWVS